MKKKVCLFLLLLLPIVSFSQNNKFKFGVQSGFYKGTNYDSIQSGNNIAIEFSGKLSKRFSLTTHVNYGWNRYFESERSNHPEAFLYSDGTNADLFNIHVGIIAGYTINLTENMHITGYSGLSTYTERLTYWWDFGEMIIGHREYSFTTIAFPVKISIGYLLSKNIELGIAAGFYLEPAYPIVGLHAGPKINFLF
jgi:hypothetical protein